MDEAKSTEMVERLFRVLAVGVVEGAETAEVMLGYVVDGVSEALPIETSLEQARVFATALGGPVRGVMARDALVSWVDGDAFEAVFSGEHFTAGGTWVMHVDHDGDIG